MPRSYLYPFECLSGREVSPKVPVGAGWFVHEGPSWLARFVCEPERGVKVDSVRGDKRPPPTGTLGERSLVRAHIHEINQ